MENFVTYILIDQLKTVEITTNGSFDSTIEYYFDDWVQGEYLRSDTTVIKFASLLQSIKVLSINLNKGSRSRDRDLNPPPPLKTEIDQFWKFINAVKGHRTTHGQATLYIEFEYSSSRETNLKITVDDNRNIITENTFDYQDYENDEVPTISPLASIKDTFGLGAINMLNLYVSNDEFQI